MKQITYNKFGKRMGRLGNSMFQLASLYGMSIRYGRELRLPEWNYQEYFEYEIPICERGDFKKDVSESSYSFTGWDYWDTQFLMRNNEETVSVTGWLQTSKYWSERSGDVKFKLFTFKNDFRASVGAKFSDVLNNGKENIAISIRVGDDYKENGNYVILPINYYIGALYEYFAQWRENYNIIVFTDDFEYAKLNLDCSDNIYFAEGLSDIEQLCLMTMCDHFILPNSTFSWWGAYLGEKKHSKVIHPAHYFKGHLYETSSIKDFWEPHWETYDHKDKKFNLTDVEFHIPVAVDHNDRIENLHLVSEFITRNFDTTIRIGENGRKLGEYFNVESFNYEHFHRTKMLNELCKSSRTPFIVNYDADNIVPLLQILIAVDMLRKEEAEMVYPYDGRCARVDRGKWYSRLMDDIDCGIFKGETFRGTRSFDPTSVGHIIFWNKEAFIRFGMENENFISYGPEDVERWERAQKLGISVKRTGGITYHIDHWCGPDSSGKNPFFGANYDELERIRRMTREELERDIISWKWREEVYSVEYYDELSGTAMKSAVEIFVTLYDKSETEYCGDYCDIMKNIKSVLDIGCGIGEWGEAVKKFGLEYKGVDYRIPQHKLMIPKEDYREYNLRSTDTFPFPDKFDMVVCCEVLEHLEPEYADSSIDLICSKADVVLFSAAIPYQGGFQHYNEQWQDYWAAKFAERGYYPVYPVLYYSVKDNKNIDIWYRNNLVLYQKNPNLVTNVVERYVHPDLYINILGTMTEWIDSNKKKQRF